MSMELRCGMESGVEMNNERRGNSEDSAEFPGNAPQRYSWYDDNNDTWYFASSIEELRNLWENLANEKF